MDADRRRALPERHVRQRAARGRPAPARGRRPGARRAYGADLPAPGATDRAVTLAPSELPGTPSFADQQQRILRALCRPLFGDGEGLEAATDATVAAETGIHVETVARELDHLGRTFGLQAMPQAERRSEIALLAVRSGLVSADDQP